MSQQDLGTCTGIPSPEQKYEITCFTLNFTMVAIYLTLFTASTLLMKRKIGESQKKWQAFFHSFFMASTLARAAHFVFLSFSFTMKYNLVLDVLPSFLFFSAYLVLLFFWMEIFYYNSSDLSNFRSAYIRVNIFLYTVILGLLIADIIVYRPFSNNPPLEDQWSPIEITIHSFTAFVYFALVCSFGFYGYQLYQIFSSRLTPTSNQGTVSSRTAAHTLILRKLVVVTLFFTVCFLLRATLIIVWMALDLKFDWWFDPVFYFFCEVIPVSILFWSFQAEAPKPIMKRASNTDRINDSRESSTSQNSEKSPLI
eukprot:NODE_880_length_1138_cov_96.088032_g838_i0.p1 GENE.NODE_880_length_1138_cov_96.088032_g838_i0~~NODE_880_length_1138_cov_96.088032_g838_i0.p1  ORF type:complete len:361 (+),score=38.46 NODE_880_length_1138_cov_96.088032_g838_i0:153-1085(+)